MNPIDESTYLEADQPTATRRTALKTGLGLAAGLAVSAPATSLGAEPPAPPLQLAAPFADSHDLKPLPFDAGRLNGLSRALLESHWQNNYGGSVRALNETNRRLEVALADSDYPAFAYNDLKREHLMRTGSVVLHELYFANLGGDGRPPAELRTLIGTAFGTFDAWETEFRRMAAGLGGGSGWVMLGYNRELRALENYWMADHLHGPVSTAPLLVIDMYEHSYHMDFGAATARYVDAFFRNVDWETVGERLQALG